MAPEGQQSSKRLLVVGDVHGCFDELQELLNVANFSPEHGDHLVFTGGLIGGGPDSMKTIDLARKWNSSCVRGFAEDRVLLTRRKIKDVEHIIEEEEKHDTGRVKLATVLSSEPGVMGEREIAERKLANDMTDEQAAYLEQCPVILRLGELGDEKGDMGDVVVVHGGLVPGVSLENQDPSAVMTVRTVDTEMHVPYDSGVGVDWAKVS
ncbi:hypothetical protein KEM55_001406 [Ascosphaera atra]|nr:hypothetical protein KEM55_001406 [Ascosphaera atra]